MELYKKYRPTSLDQVRGNAETVATLTTMLTDVTKFPHSILLSGPTGTGKTTIARIIADRLGVKGMDFQEINTASNRGIDTVRELINKSGFKGIEGRCRFYMIDEAHGQTGTAQDAFLKILEDTPAHVYFVLCTTEIQKVAKAVQNRCTIFQLNPLNERQMYGLLRQVVMAEGAELDRVVYDQIILDSLGSARAALVILEKVLNTPVELRLEAARRSAAQQSESIELCRALMKDGGSWKEIADILTRLKDQEAETIRRQVIGYAQAVLLKENKKRAGIVLDEFIEPFYNSGFPALTLACYKTMTLY